MSSRVKYGSAFSPVIPSKSILNHPFSIKNLLNLDDQGGADKEDNKTTTDFPTPCQHLPRKTRPMKEDKGLAADKLNLNCLWPAWVYATRYSRHGIPAANYTNPRRPRKPIKRQKQRPLFTPEQLHKLEEEFVNEKYISKSRRCKLALEISLTEAQVRTWFQNRRTRWRKEVHEEDEDPSWTTHSGMSKYDTSVLGGNSMIIRGYCS
ncbi:homeobox protein engrailed-2-A-like [Orbicella faveolata]|uniref:homeobox protein engrailed-2-A-like n=1 Tax=Orbicella faveolata TaxID=48498 RepID=UPI0009E64725|nr:homeobox protein engrailed-2-A-like [Orbicella faveolata]